MNKIRLVSDLHLEFGPLDLPAMEDESSQILVIAGDMGLAGKSLTYIPFLEQWSERFQDIIYIMGNHEYYNSSILRALDKINDDIRYQGGMENVHVVDNEVIRIGNVSFVCSTLWASYNTGDPVCLFDARQKMNDHRKIRTGTPSAPYQRKFLPEDAIVLYNKGKDFIFSAIEDEKKVAEKVIVVTHHAPSYQSVAEQFRTGPYASLNGAYASNLDYNILDASPNLWIHGHTHVSFDYMIGDTRVICNPRGYHGVEENKQFNPTLVVDLSE